MDVEQKQRYDFQEGALLLIDKPLTWTSFDVVNKIRYKLKHKLKVKKNQSRSCGYTRPFGNGLVDYLYWKVHKTTTKLTRIDQKLYWNY